MKVVLGYSITLIDHCADQKRFENKIFIIKKKKKKENSFILWHKHYNNIFYLFIF